MMSRSDEFERRAFLFWARTGRRLPVQGPGVVERKFNPNHDPKTGRFTFGDAGDLAGNGGDFGGGGASGSWKPDRPASTAHPAVAAKPLAGSVQRRPAKRDASASKAPAKPATRPDPVHRAMFRLAALADRQSGNGHVTVVRNGYAFAVDRAQRTHDIVGHLASGTVASRSRTAQARAGGADRQPKDDGGHFIARRFNGPAEPFNHFAQSARFNRGAYRALEDSWARSLRHGKSVFVRIKPHYPGNSLRPSRLEVFWRIDGQPQIRTFHN